MLSDRLTAEAGSLEVFGPRCVVTREEPAQVLRVELRPATPIEQLLAPRDDTLVDPVIEQLGLRVPDKLKAGNSVAKGKLLRPVWLLEESEAAWDWVREHAGDGPLRSCWRHLLEELIGDPVDRFALYEQTVEAPNAWDWNARRVRPEVHLAMFERYAAQRRPELPLFRAAIRIVCSSPVMPLRARDRGEMLIGQKLTRDGELSSGVTRFSPLAEGADEGVAVDALHPTGHIRFVISGRPGTFYCLALHGGGVARYEEMSDRTKAKQVWETTVATPAQVSEWVKTVLAQDGSLDVMDGSRMFHQGGVRGLTLVGGSTCEVAPVERRLVQLAGGPCGDTFVTAQRGTRSALMERAAELGVRGRSKMSADELRAAVAAAAAKATDIEALTGSPGVFVRQADEPVTELVDEAPEHLEGVAVRRVGAFAAAGIEPLAMRLRDEQPGLEAFAPVNPFAG